jgi:hypothetical protein
MKNQPKKPPTPRQRLFTNEFKLGDLVSVTREEHGWHEGAVQENRHEFGVMLCYPENENLEVRSCPFCGSHQLEEI